MKNNKENNVDSLEKTIYNPVIRVSCNINAEIIRIYRTLNQTQIDFVYHIRPVENCTAWIRIDKDTYIQPTNTKIKLFMTGVLNIPIAPRTIFINSITSFYCFSLFFPPLPKNVTEINIIEKDNPEEDWFNFRGVLLNNSGKSLKFNNHN